jgi:FMN phosphatase YigB (HAD superfamily)
MYPSKSHVIFADDNVENVIAAQELGMTAVQCVDIRNTYKDLRKTIGIITTS